MSYVSVEVLRLRQIAGYVTENIAIIMQVQRGRCTQYLPNAVIAVDPGSVCRSSPMRKGSLHCTCLLSLAGIPSLGQFFINKSRGMFLGL